MFSFHLFITVMSEVQVQIQFNEEMGSLHVGLCVPLTYMQGLRMLSMCKETRESQCHSAL